MMDDQEVTGFFLESSDKISPTWRKLVEYFNAKLMRLRAKNDGELSPDQTAILRGQIQCLKALLRLGDEPPVIDG